MATRAASISLAPTLFERALAIAAIALLLTVLTAIARGHSEWTHVPVLIWLHLVTIGAALLLTPIMLLRRRGDDLHRQLGWAWALAMFTTACLSFGIHVGNPHGFSPIHILSVITVITVPMMVLAARSHRVAQHRRSARIIITAALLIAGFFTFPFDRLLGHWLFG